MSPADIMDHAVNKARQSFCRFRISAIALDKNGNFLASATNKPRMHKRGGGIHAEMAVLKKAGPKTRTIIICRIGNSGIIRAIDPCDSCKRTLDKLGIKVYSIV